VEIYCCR